MITVGPSRLVLINAGRYDYADVDLTRPLHLVGPNNIGKTTLVNALQFLYVDDLRRMHFADKRPEETRRYYFPGLHSYILFETVTRDGGFRTVGLRGLGPARAYEYERFAYSGPYRDEDFVDSASATVREPEDVLGRLSIREYLPLKPHQLRVALIGGSDDAGADLGLLPLRNRSDYPRFRTVFGNLLRLSHLRQDDLKELFFRVYDPSFRQRQVRLAADFAAPYRIVRRQKRELDSLRAAEADARAFLSDHAERGGIRATLVSLWPQLLRAAGLQKQRIDGALAQNGKRAAALGDDIGKAEARRIELRDAQAAANEEKGGLRQKLSHFERLEREFSNVLEELERSRLDQLQNEHDEVSFRLRDVGTGNPVRIERQLAESERRLATLRERRSALADNLLHALAERLSREDMTLLFRVLNPDLLGIRLGPDGVVILEPNLLEHQLREMLARMEHGQYRDAAMQVKLDRLDVPNLDAFSDAALLDEEILSRKDDARRLEVRLETARDTEAAGAEQRRLREELDQARQRLRGYQKYAASKLEAEGWRARNKALETELGRLSSESDNLDGALSDLHRQADAAAREKAQLQSHAAAIDERLRGLKAPPPEWQIGEPGGKDEGDNADFETLCDIYARRRDQELALTAHIEGRMAGLRTQLPRIAAEDEDELADALRGELEAIAEKEKALTEGWKGFISSLGNAFDGLLQDLERLRARITDLNRLLARASVSDLQNLKLEVRDQPELVPQLRHVVEHQARGAFDLFDDPEAFDRAAQQLEAFLDENPELRLPDLFHVEFLVTRADGQTQRYPHLDKVESNGTSITIKVLTNLMLLRGLFRDTAEFQLPFFLDESNALDRDNLAAIVALAREQQFVAILASPDVSDAADQLYFPELAENGRVVIREPHRVIVRGLDEGGGDALEPGPDRASAGA